jgi:DNA polymerase-3 subunit alpha
MGVLQIDDGYERLELVVFSELYDAIRHAINVDQTVVVEGEASIDAYNDQLKINALSVQTIEQYVESGVKSFGLSLEEKELGYLQQFIKNTIDENKALSSKKVQLLVDGDDYRVALSAENLAINVHALAAQSEKFAQHGISLRL